MSSQPGRDDPCPCGSGEKYERCCSQQGVESAAAAVDRAAEQEPIEADGTDVLDEIDYEDRLTHDSNAVVNLLHEGKLDQAEAAARDLLKRHPQVHDGYDCLGMVYEARGQRKQAADCYRKVIEFVRHHPQQYDPGFEKRFQRWVSELDAPADI